MKIKTPILWLDLETTGLDPDAGSVLEVAAQLWRAGEDWDHVRDQLDVDSVVQYKRPAAVVDQMNDYVRSMHGNSGLVVQMLDKDYPREPLDAIERRLVALCQECGEKPVLAGNSVHFDRRWIDRHMPRLSLWLSHRHLDVSGPFMYGLPEISDGVLANLPMANHRAASDVRRSQEILLRIRRRVVNSA